MTVWGFHFALNWLLLPVAVWLGRKYWLATRQPALKYLQHTRVSTSLPGAGFTKENAELFYNWYNHLRCPELYKTRPPLPNTGGSALVDVMRRQESFPWLVVKETWLVSGDSAVRECDGEVAGRRLRESLLGCIAVADARRAELEDLVK